MVPLTVKFFTPGVDVLAVAPVYSFTQNTTKSGSTAITQLSGITPGTYDITVKSNHTLTNVKLSVVISQNPTAVSMGTLLEGNAKEDTAGNALIISGADFSTLSLTWNKVPGDPGFNANADFDLNGIVSGGDFSLLSLNWNKIQPVTVP